MIIVICCFLGACSVPSVLIHAKKNMKDDEEHTVLTEDLNQVPYPEVPKPFISNIACPDKNFPNQRDVYN